MRLVCNIDRLRFSNTFYILLRDTWFNFHVRQAFVWSMNALVSLCMGLDFFFNHRNTRIIFVNMEVMFVYVYNSS